MNTTESLLVEIRTEELPPRQVERLARDFTARLLEDLRGEGFADADSRPRCDSGGGGAPVGDAEALCGFD